jgi:phosphotransferase system IIB component
MLGDLKDNTNLNTSNIKKHTNPSCVVQATNISIIIGRMTV